MTTSDVKISSFSDSPNSDCSAFLNWDEKPYESESEKAVVFRSLVATVEIPPPLNVSLETKAVQFLESVTTMCRGSADAFINSFERTADESLTNFVQSIVVLISSPSQAIIKAARKILETLILWCSPKVHLALVKADIIHHLIITLNPLSLSFAEAVDIHMHLMNIINYSLRLQTQNGLNELRIEDGYEQQAVRETVLKQVLIPSKQNRQELAQISNCIWLLLGKKYSDASDADSEGSKYVVAKFIAVLETCSVITHALPPHSHPPTPLCLSFTTHTLPLPTASPSPLTPSHSPLPPPHHPHPPTPLSLTTHTLPLPSASPSPPAPSHSPLPLPHHPRPPTPLCLSLTTHALPLPSASPSPPTPSHSPLPLPHHPHPPTPLCLSLSTHTLPLPSPSPSPHSMLYLLAAARSSMKEGGGMWTKSGRGEQTEETTEPTQASPAVYKRSDRQNTVTADLATCHIVSTVAAILAGLMTSSPSLTPCVGAVS
ncbi:hypothetical protein BLNAU_18664 [Blattamonas nauphoetae]|uniref:Uncharacterized protein n=1 Tax=Blattamonas nauphoetae TaxID=2049346 RepID=A0ABQ9X4A6_9EUKA|nr:hypothetical protein BLNAU_18664 [Blattamonas nauphoetae]